MELIIILLLVVFLFASTVYKWFELKQRGLLYRRVPHEKPKPFVGNVSGKLLMGRTSLMALTLKRYRKYKNEKVYGVYNFVVPAIFIRDVDLIKKIAIKDFDSFRNHSFVGKLGDDVFDRSLVSLEDNEWKVMRGIVSPLFTGSKMRLMFDLISVCCMEGVRYIEDEMGRRGQVEIELEMKDFFTRFTNDVIASAAFGIKVNSYKQRTNEFYTIGTAITQFRVWMFIKILLFRLMPNVMKALGISTVNKRMVDYFSDLVIDAMKYRQEHNIIRPDMIQLLMEAKEQFNQSEKSGEDRVYPELRDIHLLAQCMVFFAAGFETVSTCLSFTIYELSMNMEVQQRLYEEVAEVNRELAGDTIDYDSLMKMKYLDMVVSESLRKWPPATLTDRLASSDYRLTDDDDNLVVEIKKGDTIFFPIAAYHHDPDYFPEPEKFMPERFAEENKHLMKSAAYLPFGIGPRSCIGNRFALMETKAMVYHLLLQFKLLPTDNTPRDMMKSLKGLTLMPKEKFWTRFVPRNT